MQAKILIKEIKKFILTNVNFWMKKMIYLRKIFKNQDGATAIEYALLAALIGIFCIGAFTYLGDEVQDTTVGAADGLKKAQADAVTQRGVYKRD
jgi:pilus assembly protein Flp/PilA